MRMGGGVGLGGGENSHYLGQRPEDSDLEDDFKNGSCLRSTLHCSKHFTSVH